MKDAAMPATTALPLPSRGSTLINKRGRTRQNAPPTLQLPRFRPSERAPCAHNGHKRGAASPRWPLRDQNRALASRSSRGGASGSSARSSDAEAEEAKEATGCARPPWPLSSADRLIPSRDKRDDLEHVDGRAQQGNCSASGAYMADSIPPRRL